MGIFKRLRPCCRGTAVKTSIVLPVGNAYQDSGRPTETAPPRQPEEDVDGGGIHVPVRYMRRVKSTNMTTSRNWRPKLYAIHEDGDLGSEDNSSGEINGKQKANIPIHADYHRRSASLWALQGISPAPLPF